MRTQRIHRSIIDGLDVQHEVVREVTAHGLLSLRVEAQVAARRLEILEEAVRKITQRVNLFDKVLIPKTRDNIRRIQIVLSDAEKAAVVNAKIAKRKRQRT